MRQSQHGKKPRGRGRKPHNPLSRVYDSNGPDVKIRGSASHIAEKYLTLARDAHSSGDRIAAESYYQHAEHYLRIIAAAQAQSNAMAAQANEQPSSDDMDGDDDRSSAQQPGQSNAPQPNASQPNASQANASDGDQGSGDQNSGEQRSGRRRRRGPRPDQNEGANASGGDSGRNDANPVVAAANGNGEVASDSPSHAEGNGSAESYGSGNGEASDSPHSNQDPLNA